MKEEILDKYYNVSAEDIEKILRSLQLKYGSVEDFSEEQMNIVIEAIAIAYSEGWDAGYADG